MSSRPSREKFYVHICTEKFIEPLQTQKAETILTNDLIPNKNHDGTEIYRRQIVQSGSGMLGDRIERKVDIDRYIYTIYTIHIQYTWKCNFQRIMSYLWGKGTHRVGRGQFKLQRASLAMMPFLPPPNNKQLYFEYMDWSKNIKYPHIVLWKDNRYSDNRQMDRQIDIQIERWIDRLIYRQRNGQID